MKTLKLIALAAFALLFSQCKTTAPTAPTGPAPSILEVQQILDTTSSKFLQYADSTNGDPWRAIMLTANWVTLQPNVQTVSTIDSTYIDIILKSGLETDFYFNLVNDSGYSIFRGGGGKSQSPAHISFPTLSKNTITNKKVLIYAPAWTEFNLQSTVPKTVNTLSNSGLGLEVTVLKDEECTPAIANTFKDYGLVILDTHGQSTAYMSGTIIDIPYSNRTESQYKDAVILQAGQDVYDRIISKDYRIIENLGGRDIPNWQKRKDLQRTERVFVTTQYIKSLASMPNTVIFGNMCYSGYSYLSTQSFYPMKTAFMDKNLISYYGYALDNGRSVAVTDQFSKDMEDSLTKRLVNDLDSTGIANLRPSDGAEFFDNYLNHITLLFKHFGADDYSYQKCGDSILDTRDGQKYATVCIGKQVWMAQNLNYYVPGSECYDSLSSNCDTYGKLYDRALVMNGAGNSSANPSGVQGICPKGWHLPSAAEWTQLIDFLGGSNVAGGAMKSLKLWGTTNVEATNSSGFSALGGGEWVNSNFALTKRYRNFYSLGSNGFFHTASEIHPNQVDVMTVYQGTAAAQWTTYPAVTPPTTAGNVSCRCVKDP